MLLYNFSLKTPQNGMYPITGMLREAISKSGVKSGIAVVFCPHTTAGITINENADPDVVIDLNLAFNKTFPDRPEFRHAEGNSAAHLKTTLTGSSETIIIESSAPLLGTWQGLYFCEFDAPRSRRFYIKIMPD